jgi:hypothetical protein
VSYRSVSRGSRSKFCSSAAMQRLIDDTRAEGKQKFAAVRAGIGEVRTEMRVLHEDLTHLLFEHAT